MYHWLDPTAAVPLPSSTPEPSLSQESQREAAQRHAARLYEQLQAAVAAEDWAEVIHLGGQIQAVVKEYRDVRRVVVVARGKLQIPRTTPKAESIRSAMAQIKKLHAVTSRHLLLWLVGIIGAIVVVWIIGAYLDGSVSPPISLPTSQPTKIPSKNVSELGTVCDGRGCNGEEQRREKDEATVVYVPAGAFTMGSDASDADAGSDEIPQHDVTLDGFWIDKYEVTNDRYVRCVKDGNCNTSKYTDDEILNDPDHSVVGVSWRDAVDYCNWAGARLPTEAEWEYAARGKDGRLFPWDTDDTSCVLANHWGNDGMCVGTTAIVGSYPKGVSWVNAFDMVGNVWEWVQDWYNPDYYGYSPEQALAGSETNTVKVLRGGSWSSLKRDIRVANRDYNGWETFSDSDVGFRCAQE
ncbi:MAG: formylglycine-generating enzyme family protein [Ardenticatenaceae bacterium]|nr:formylglycine-generating enzyme family protein [Ardenticatenaceae bacterium]